MRRLLVHDPNFWQRYGVRQAQLEVQVIDYKEYEIALEQGPAYSNPFDTQADSFLEGESVQFQAHTQSDRDYLSLIRELLSMSDKSNIESIHGCQRVEGQEKPTGYVNYLSRRTMTSTAQPDPSL